jgi:RNA polymerase sigma-70 factor (ECF subfamily)
MGSTPCADAFVTAAALETEIDRPLLEARLATLCARAAAQVPEVEFEGPLLSAALGAHPALRAIVLADGEPALDDLALGEVVLAAALRRGDARAHALFDQRYIAPLDGALAHLRLDPTALDEVKQHVRTRLLLPGEDGALRLEEYAGRGRLTGLVRVVATRAALDLFRRAPRDAPSHTPDLLDLPDVAPDPALEALARRCREAFRDAFAEAARTLAARERNLLRLHLLSGVPLEPLAAMYGVHRATVVRWLADARRSLLATTRKGLQTRLRVRPDELESLMGLLESQLEVSVERLLRSQLSDGEPSRA